MTRIEYDPGSRGMYIRVADKPFGKTIMIDENVNIDLDPWGTVTGIEILDADPPELHDAADQMPQV